MEKQTRSGPVLSRDLSNHRLLRLRNLAGQVSHGAAGDVPQSEADDDSDSLHHLPERGELLRHAAVLAYAGV